MVSEMSGIERGFTVNGIRDKQVIDYWYRL